MNKNLPTLPKSLLDVIGEYGMARTDGASPLDVQHRWELLIAGIKDYAASVSAKLPWDERIFALYKDALEVFDGPETPQAVRDVIEWYHGSLLATQPPQDERGQAYAKCWVCGRPMDGKSEDDCHCFHRRELAASVPAQQAGQTSELLGIVRTAMAQANVIIKADGDKGDRSQAMLDLPLTLRVIETAIATPPQPVAAEAITEEALAEAVRNWFPDRINQAEYFAAAVFGHPKNAHQEHIAAMAGTGSDESKKGEA